MEHSVDLDSKKLYQYHSGAPSISDYDAALTELQARIVKITDQMGVRSIESFEKELPGKIALRKPQKLVNAYAEALVEQGAKNSKIVVFDADLKLDCGLIPFEKKFPERFVECGIAEQDMVSQAGGLALQGYLPVVHSFACFLTTRANEQIYNNATEKTKVIYCGSLAGLLPAGPGHSHQSVRDIDILSAVPGLDLIQPSCEQEVKMMVEYCVNSSSCSSYLRLTSIPYEISFQLPDTYIIQKGRGCVLREGKDILLITYGPVMLSQALRAAETLENEIGIQVAIINLPWLNYVNNQWLKLIVEKFNVVVTLDDHYVKGGVGEMIAAKIAHLPVQSEVYSYGLKEIPASGMNEDVLAYHSLDHNSIRSKIIDIVNVTLGKAQ